MEEALVRNGWPEKKGSLRRDWLLANMALALKLYRADMRNPTLEREALQTLSANELSEQLKQRSLSSIVTRIRLNRPAPQRDATFDGAQAQTELEELNATFPKLKLTPEMTTYVPQLHAWRQVKAKGGMVAVTDAVRVLGYDARDEAQAKASPIDAVTALEQSESHGEAMLDVALRDFDDKAQRDAADQQTLQYAQDLAALLPADDAARLLKLLTARWDGVKRALPAARRKVVEDIRNTMFDKAREVLSSAAQSLPKNPFPREYGGIAVGSSNDQRRRCAGERQPVPCQRRTEPDEGVDPERLGPARTGPLILGREAAKREGQGAPDPRNASRQRAQLTSSDSDAAGEESAGLASRTFYPVQAQQAALCKAFRSSANTK